MIESIVHQCIILLIHRGITLEFGLWFHSLISHNDCLILYSCRGNDIYYSAGNLEDECAQFLFIVCWRGDYYKQSCRLKYICVLLLSVISFHPVCVCTVDHMIMYIRGYNRNERVENWRFGMGRHRGVEKEN